MIQSIARPPKWTVIDGINVGYKNSTIFNTCSSMDRGWYFTCLSHIPQHLWTNTHWAKSNPWTETTHQKIIFICQPSIPLYKDHFWVHPGWYLFTTVVLLNMYYEIEVNMEKSSLPPATWPVSCPYVFLCRAAVHQIRQCGTHQLHWSQIKVFVVRLMVNLTLHAGC